MLLLITNRCKAKISILNEGLGNDHNEGRCSQ
uniref:Uncharacterized protein n=1 Tax=Arundo donax TaxID=35708 RepID=A0A0A8Y9P2_ARUDO